MATKKKKKKADADLPEGMTRREAKLAKRAAERAALERDPRPYVGLAAEPHLVAMQEFVPSAVAKVSGGVTGADRDVYLVTVLPGGGAAVVREEIAGDPYSGAALIALQAHGHSQNPGRDLAFALAWATKAEPGAVLESTAADGTQPALTELLPADAALEIEEFQDFSWWIPKGVEMDPVTRQGLQAANEAVVPSHQITDVDVPGSLWWVAPGGNKAHIRWVYPNDNEAALLGALARVAARGELNLGDGTRFAGVFRTHGLLVPVFDLDPEVAYDSYGAEIARVAGALASEVSNDAQLSAEERRQLENIKSRQVTIRN